jgi:hypothetical protein
MKVDNMLMLVGQEQGSGKTEGVARLLPHPDLCSIIDGQPNDPDTIYQILGCKFAVLDELLNFNDFRGWKSFLTKRVDKKRLSYGRRATLIERRCVWWGITNEPQFLTNVTGNRRYMPVEIPDGALLCSYKNEATYLLLHSLEKENCSAGESWSIRNSLLASRFFAQLLRVGAQRVRTFRRLHLKRPPRRTWSRVESRASVLVRFNHRRMNQRNDRLVHDVAFKTTGL